MFQCQQCAAATTILRKRRTVEVILTTLSGSSNESVLIVAPGECITFGRTAASQRVFAADTHMSSQHFLIENHGDWAEVRDHRSTNGTWVNNNRVSAERLKDGDQIRAGTTIFTVQLQQAKPERKNLSPVFAETLGPNVFERSPGDSNDASSTPPAARPIQTGSQQPVQETPSSPQRSDMSYPIPNDIAKHLDKRLTPFGDSIDLSELSAGSDSPIAQVPVPVESPIVEQPKLNPISESSLFPSVAERKVSSSFPVERSYCLMMKRLAVPTAQGLEAIIETLSREWSVQIVFHPLKIRQGIPASFSSVRPLWSCYGEAAQFGPVAIPWIDFRRAMHPYLERLCQADAFVVFLGVDLNAMAADLQQLTLIEVPGYSEEGGFLNCYWPSSLATMLSSIGPRVCEQLFQQSLNGLLMQSPWDRQSLIAAVTPTIGQALEELGFRNVDRLQ